MKVLVWLAAACALVAMVVAAGAVAILLRDRGRAILNARRAESYLATLQSFTGDVQYATSPVAVAAMTVNQLEVIPSIRSVFLLRARPGEDGMHLEARAGATPGDPVEALVPEGDRRCPALHSGTVIRRGKDAPAAGCSCPLGLSPHGGMLCVPLHDHGRVNGLLVAQTDREPPLSDRLAGVVETVAAIASITLSGNTARELAMRDALHDGLTGVYNRRYLEASLSQTLHLMMRLGQPLCLLMIDVDGFKMVNDRCGHKAGDRVLKAFATSVSASLREGDVVARYGGDEFVAMLPNAAPPVAREIAERVLRAIRALPPPGERLVVGGSIGLVCAPEQGWEADDLIAAADTALYRAKREGRNRVAEYVHGPDRRVATGSSRGLA